MIATFRLIRENFSIIRTFFHDSKRRIFGLVITCAVMFFATPLIVPLVAGNIIYALESNDVALFAISAFGGLITLLCVIVCVVIYMIYAEAWMINASAKGLARILAKVYRFALGELNDKYQDGELFNRLTEGTGSTAWVVTQLTISSVMLAGAVVIIALLGQASFLFLLLAIAVAACEFVRTLFETKRKTELAVNSQEENSKRESAALVTLSHLSEVLIMHGTASFEEYRQSRKRALNFEVQSAKLTAALDFVIGILYAGLLAALFLISPKQLALGTLASALLLFNRLGGQFVGIRMEWNNMASDLSNIKRLSELLVYDINNTAMKTSSPILYAKELTVVRDGVSIIDKLSFELNSNEKMVVVGESGTGKTTLLRALMGFITAKEGQVGITRSISYMPAADSLFPVSGSENVSFGFVNPCEFEGSFISTQGTASEVSSILTQSSVCENAPDTVHKPTSESIRESICGFELMNKSPAEMSVGGKQKIAVCRALSSNAELIILDEPTSSLSNAEAVEVMEAILAYSGAVLVVTHDTRFAAKFDRVLSL